MLELLHNTEISTIFDSSLQPVLDEIEREVNSIVPDTTSKKGRNEIKALAYKVTKSKTAIDKQGKILVDEINSQMKEFTDKKKLVNESRKEANCFLTKLSVKVRLPLTEYENELQRQEEVKKTLLMWDDAIAEDVLFNKQRVIAEKERIIAIKELKIQQENERIDRENEIRDQEAARAEVLRINAVAADKRAANAEKEKQLLIKQQKIDAEKRKAQALIDERMRKEQEQLRMDRVLKQRLIDEEKQKEQEKLDILEKEQKARANLDNVRHKNNAALQDLILEGIDAETAKKVIILIAKEKISYVEIRY